MSKATAGRGPVRCADRPEHSIMLGASFARTYDNLVDLAQSLCEADIALLGLNDGSKIRLQAKVGTELCEVCRDRVWWADLIDTDREWVEAQRPAQLSRVPAQGQSSELDRAKSFGAAILRGQDGQVLGALCVLDADGREFTAAQRSQLETLARTISGLFSMGLPGGGTELVQSGLAPAAGRAAGSELEGRGDQSAAEFAAVLECMPDAAVTVDMQGIPRIYNQRALAISGRRPEEFPPDPENWPSFFGLRAPNGTLLKLDEVPLVRALRGHSTEEQELLIRNEANGDGYLVSARARPLRDAKGVQIGALVIFGDISANKLAVAAAERAQARLHEFFQQSPTFNALLSADGILLEANDRAYDEPGWPQGLGKGKYFWDGPWWTPSAAAATRIKDLVLRAAKGEHLRAVCDFFVNTDSGPLRQLVEVCSSPVRDDSDEVINIFVTGMDVTERETARQSLEESERRYRALMAICPDIVFRCDMESGWNMRFMSDAVERITGYPARYFTAEGNSWASIMHPDDVDHVRAHVAKNTGRDEKTVVDYRIIHRNGSIVHIQGQARVVDDRWYEGILIDATERKRIEAQVQVSQARFHSLFHQSPLFNGLVSVDGTLLDCNSTSYEACGWTRADCVDMPFWESAWWRHADDTRRVCKDMIGRAAAGEYIQSVCDYYVNSPQGRVRQQCDFYASPVRDINGKVINIYVTGTDVTQREADKHAVENSQARLQALFQQSPLFQGLLSVDGILLECNDIALEQSGWTQEETLNKPMWEGPWWSGDPEGVNFVRDAVNRAGSGETVQSRSDYLVRTKNGVERRRADFRASPVRGANNELINIYIAIVDVTAEEEARQELLRSEERFRLMTEAVPQLLWSADETGGVVFANKGGLHYLGLSDQQFLGQAWADAVHPEDLAHTQALWSKSVSDGSPLEVQLRLRRYDGEYRWHIVRGVAQLDENGLPQRWFGTGTDVEEVRHAQAEAEAAAHSKSLFLANMSHEIRTPMNGVIGMTGLLLDTGLNAEQRDFVNVIRASGEHLLAVINDILDFSKVDAGKLQLERYSFSLRTCVEEAMELVATSASAKNIDLILDAAPELPQQVLGDAGRLRQVLVNLLSNAIKFSEKGDVIVSVRNAPEGGSDGMRRLLFAVSDAGVGIPANRMDQLFGVFSQLDNSNTRIYGGSGLGLAICKKLVEAMGGCIWAESEMGEGSTFRFEIELELGEDLPEALPASLKDKRVLLVDDNTTNLRVLRTILESWDMRVTEATSPRAALAKADAGSFDVALLDDFMPEMSGIELAQALRQCPKAGDLPMILLGSVSNDGHVADSAQFFAKILKPIRRAILLDQLAQLFSGQRRALKDSDPESLRKLAQRYPLRVLVAEDNVINQKVTLRLLQQLGYRAELAGNGIEVLDALDRQPFDVILMDIQMPEMDGFEATAKIHERYPRSPRIVAVTANALPGDAQHCLDAGMDDYLSKPIVPKELEMVMMRTGESLGRLVERRRQSEAPEDYRPTMFSALAEMYESDGAVELIQAMHGDFPRQMAMFSQAIADDKKIDAARVMHSLKSAVLTLSAQDLGHDLEQAEREFNEGDWSAAQNMAKACLQRCKVLFARLEAELPSDSSSGS